MRYLYIVILAVSCGAALAACGPDSWLGGISIAYWDECPPDVTPDPEHYLPDGGWDPCFRSERDGGADAADGSTDGSTEEDAGPHAGACSRQQCIVWPSLWQGPVWIWTGARGTEPQCPEGGVRAYEGYAHIESPQGCNPCECSSPQGSCTLPSKMIATTATQCQKGGAELKFDPPPDWDGSCDSAAQIPPGPYNSILVDPITLKEGSCEAHTQGPPAARDKHGVPLALDWTSIVGCHGDGWSPCGDVVTGVCIPQDAPRPSDFKLCILRQGEDHMCPRDLWTDGPYVYYEGIDDQRSCTDCACGEPQGSMCVAKLSVDNDAVCMAPVAQVTMSSEKTTCFDIQPPGQTIRSKSATAPTYIPGSCKPVEATSSGVAKGVGSSTFCCIP